MLSTSGLSHYPRPNPPLTGLTLATRHENLYPSLSCPPRPPSQTAPEPVFNAAPPPFAHSLSRMSNETCDQLGHPEL